MAPQRYERVRSRPLQRAQHHDHQADIHDPQIAADDDTTQSPIAVPNSPPPSFRSHNSSRRPSDDDAPPQNEQQRNLNDAFDAPSDDDSDDEPRDQRRLIQTERTPSHSSSDGDSPSGEARPTGPHRTVTEIPVFVPPPTASGRPMGGGSQANDGVFANITAKPRPGEELEEKPPTYEQAAADATPPYWETTVLSTYGVSGNPDDVFVDGLLVGSVFSFVWNGLISMSFQLIGFLLTYLLHTTHAAKHGSRAGLGVTLVQFGFSMRYSGNKGPMDGAPGPDAPTDGVPDDPNAHDFDPSEVVSGGGAGMSPHGLSTADWLSYVLMIVGWFILIRAVSDFIRARRQEAIIRSSPDRGLGVAVIADNETPETSV